MTPGARLQSAIDLLDQIAASRRPADQIIRAWGGANRYAGSKDRRAIADRVYLCLRSPAGAGQGGRAQVLASLTSHDGLAPDEIADLFSGEGHAPQPLSAEETQSLGAAAPAVLAPFLQAELEAGLGANWAEEVGAITGSRAPLDIRINGLKTDLEAIAADLARASLAAEPTAFSALALRIEGSPHLAALDLFKAGAFEVQDEASQVAAFLAASAKPSLAVDYCAGGGGKTLALGQVMGRAGRLVACDINPRRLDAIKPRLARAGAQAEFHRVGPTGDPLNDLEGQADLVLVDAPCSGSGTWRRRPEEASRLTAEALERLSREQSAILERAAELVRPGGRLAYVTCSLLASENGAVADAFAAQHAEFRPLPIAQAALTPLIRPEGQRRLAELAQGGHRLQMSPRRTGTDGFFIALFQRTA